ncbi:MAG: TolC family protein, partial [Deltaproteobacteria bacterium]|nr:TolC family protein [Deltaproteobacteria bacterium]
MQKKPFLRFRSKVSLLAVISLFLLFLPARAPAETISLSELLSEARENNPELKAYGERIKARQARAGSEGRLDDPTLKIEMEDLPKDNPLNIAPGNAMLTRYTISQMFPFPGKLSLKEKIALKEARTAISELNAKELEVSAMVKEAYFEYAYLSESIRKTGEIRDILSYMAEIAGTRYSTGQVSQQDVIKVNFETSMLTNDLITLEAEKGIAAARLK